MERSLERRIAEVLGMRPDVIAVYLFGSMARGTSRSDILSNHLGDLDAFVAAVRQRLWPDH